MTQSSTKQRISITVDAKLLQDIDKLTENRSGAVEEGLRLWHRLQIENQLRTFYQSQKTTDQKQFAQGQMEEILDEERL